nr:inducible metalloproteinase inhibitor protein-like [Onthophagus taurus]
MKYAIVFAILVATTYIACTDACECGGLNEVYGEGPSCDQTCAKLDQSCYIVNIKANKRCYCIDGYARNEWGICVPKAFCRLIG